MPPPHLCDPDEDLQLVDVELLIHALGEPGPQQVHGGSVPLLKHINTTPSSKTNTRAHNNNNNNDNNMCRVARNTNTAQMLLLSCLSSISILLSFNPSAQL